MMKFESSHTIAAPRDVVWAMLMENGRLSPAMPHVRLLERLGEKRYRGILNVGLGPLGGDYEGTIALSDLEAPAGFRVDFAGRGWRGNFSGNGHVRLQDQGQTTILHCQGDVHFEGELADLPPRLLQTNINAIIRRTVEGIERALGLRENETDALSTSPAYPGEPWSRAAVIGGLVLLGGLIIGLVRRKKNCSPQV